MAAYCPSTKITSALIGKAFVTCSILSFSFVCTMSQLHLYLSVNISSLWKDAVVVGAKNLLGRSNDKQISCDDHISDVKDILHRRHVTWVRQGRHPIISVPLENCLPVSTETVASVPPDLGLSAELESTRDLNEELS